MSAPDTLCLAEVGIGAVRVGVPAATVLQAIALPDAPALLPRRRGALLGVVEYEGQLVPVVDLARWVEVGAAPAQVRTGARVLVLREAGRTIGLRVDSVGGLVEVPLDAVTRLHHDDAPDEVFHSAVRAPEGGAILSLLDVARLSDLAVAWHQDDASCSTGAANAEVSAEVSATGDEAALQPYALLQAGSRRLGVPAADLVEVIPMPKLERFGGGLDMAYCRWRGRHLPVLPAGVLSAPGEDARAAADRPAPGLLAVIERAGLALGLPVEAALQLHAFDGGGLAASDGISVSAFDGDGNPVQLIDGARLFARFPEAALSREPDAGPAHCVDDGSAGAGGNPGAYLVFEANGLSATAIDAVERILGPSEVRAALDGAGGMAWEGRAIPLRDLRAPAHGDLHGAAGSDATAQPAPHVMVVRAADGHVGCAVARVHLLVPPGTARLYRMGAGARAVEFITTGEGVNQASYRIVDLAVG